MRLISGIVAAVALTACSTGGASTPDTSAAASSASEPSASDPSAAIASASEELQDPSVVSRLDPETGSVLGEMPILARVAVGRGFGSIVVDGDVWVLNTGDQTLSHIDGTTNSVSATVALDSGVEPGDLALAAGDLWVSDPVQNRVVRVDGATDSVAASIPVGMLPQGVVEADGDVWVGNHHGRPTGSVWRIDARDGQVVAKIPVGNNPMFGPQFMAAAAGSVWVGVPGLKAVVRIDPTRNEVVATVPVADGGVCGQLVADDDAVWVPSGGCGDGALTRIDPSTNEVVARITSPDWGAVFGGALGFGSLWISTDHGPFEVDPASNEVVGRLALAGDPVWGGHMAVGAGSLWVHDGDAESVIRIGPPG